MATVPITLQRLWADRDSGRLGDLCHRAGIDLLVVFGDSLRRPGSATSVDLAFSCGEDGAPAVARLELVQRYGDHLRVHALDGMGPRLRHDTLTGSALLVGQARGKFSEMLTASTPA